MGPARAQLRARIPSIPSGSIFGTHWGPRALVGSQSQKCWRMFSLCSRTLQKPEMFVGSLVRRTNPGCKPPFNLSFLKTALWRAAMFWKCSDISKPWLCTEFPTALQMSLLPRAVSFSNGDYRGLFSTPEMSCKGSRNWVPGNVPKAAETRGPSGPDGSLGPVDTPWRI